MMDAIDKTRTWLEAVDLARRHGVTRPIGTLEVVIVQGLGQVAHFSEADLRALVADYDALEGQTCERCASHQTNQVGGGQWCNVFGQPCVVMGNHCGRFERKEG